uniref:ATP synthase complex subunit 8 n=1 Tax=Staphylinidae sp. BMNH 1274207 TaxID=1796558 RepID=A0A140EGT3_9COLE|nr:ATP synthase F0 subunit 8 [Staphylinidae sp. BMNH 1274207]
MPQMAPLNWITLFIYFSFIFMLFNSMNYFSFIYKSKTSNIKKLINKLNWKW